MLYLIGLGLSHDSISRKGLEITKRCKKIYLESYTVEPLYPPEAIEEIIGRKVILADRRFVESLEIIDEAKKEDVALLIYGSPLTATTHIALLQEAKNTGIKTEVIYNASVFDAVAETGLQLYKFGKITSMPKWQNNFTPDSFIEIIKQNISEKSHSLILIDIGLKFKDALQQLKEASEKNNLNIKEIVVCQALGTDKQRIVYSDFEKLKDVGNVIAPYCFIVTSSELHFMEKEFLESFKQSI